MTIEQLEQQLAALPSDEEAPLAWAPLPLTDLQRRIAELQQQRRTLEHRLSTAQVAKRIIEDSEHHITWGDREENEWRPTLCDELRALPPRIRDRHLLEVQRSIDLSIQVIDFGLGVLEGTEHTLATLRLGELILASGYAPVDDAGTPPWHGSLPEVERIALRRAQAQAALEEALLDEDERAKRDAEAKELRDAFNTMRVKLSGGGSSLVAYTSDGEVLDVAAMTPVQRKAFERANAIEAAAEAARRAPRPLKEHGTVSTVEDRGIGRIGLVKA